MAFCRKWLTTCEVSHASAPLCISCVIFHSWDFSLVISSLWYCLTSHSWHLFRNISFVTANIVWRLIRDVSFVISHSCQLVPWEGGTYTATHCNTLQHTAAHCSTLQHAATHCHILQHHCNPLQHTAVQPDEEEAKKKSHSHCNTLQHTATHCNTLQHTALYTCGGSREEDHTHTATHCNTLQHTATHCNTLQHTATHCLI